MTDDERELEIERYYRRMLNAPTDSLQRIEFKAMIEHIRERSPAQIEKMERDYGLLH